MKKTIGLFLAFVVLCALPAQAFLYEVQALDKAAIAKLSDDQLVEAYIDAAVELETSKDFHQAAGFTPKEYDQQKKLLRYKIDLFQEFQKRKLDVPKLEP